MEQDHQDFVHLIYNNSEVQQTLAAGLPSNILLVNNYTNLKTGRSYENLGQIYNDAVTFIPEDVEIVNFADDDDMFLPTHLSEGVKGYLKGGKLAYKPQRSYYYAAGKLSLVENVLEPSIFVQKEHLLKYGFSDATTEQHHQWFQPLVNEGNLYVDPEGAPTLIYDWSQEIPTFKTSGDPYNSENFGNYKRHSVDHGDRVITPVPKNQLKIYDSNFFQ